MLLAEFTNDETGAKEKSSKAHFQAKIEREATYSQAIAVVEISAELSPHAPTGRTGGRAEPELR
jgi:hypothetical protein